MKKFQWEKNFHLDQINPKSKSMCWNGRLKGYSSATESQTCDWKVTGSSPGRNSRRMVFSGINCLCWFWFQCLFHPHVTTVAWKRSRSFCQKHRLHLNTHAPYARGLEWSNTVNQCMVVWCTQNMHHGGRISLGTSHVTTKQSPCTPLQWLFKKRTIKS